MDRGFRNMGVALALWLFGATGWAVAQQPPQAAGPAQARASGKPLIASCEARPGENGAPMSASCRLDALSPAEDKADQAVLSALAGEGPLGPHDLQPDRLSSLPYPAANEPWPAAGEATPGSQATWMKWRQALSEGTAEGSKEAFYPRTAPPAVWTMPFKGPPVGAPWMRLVEVGNEGELQVIAHQVRPAQGLAWPDPEIWVLEVTSKGDPEVGRLLAHADDSATGLPEVSLKGLKAGTYRVVVSSYTQETGGWVRLTIKAGEREVLKEEEVPFGGVAFKYEKVRQGERFLAGAYGHSGALRHDTFLVLLPLAGGADARYVASNNDMGLLPMVEAPQQMEAGLLLLGTFPEAQRPRVKVIRTRPAMMSVGLDSEGGAAEALEDRDGDGLTGAAEALLGSCDSREQATSGGCRAPRPLPWSWSPVDTDNDGTTDFEEVYGLRRCFRKVPVPPNFGVSSCVMGSGGRCTDVCPPGSYEIEVAMSAMDSPLPTRHDIYVELDWWSEEQPYVGPALDKAQVADILRIFGKEWSHNIPEGQGFRKGNPVVKLHLYQDDIVGAAPSRAFAHIPATGLRYLFFNMFFNANRRYAGIFYYILLKQTGSGQSDVGGRAAIVGTGKRVVAVTNLVHELGHLVGLQHNGTAGEPTNTPFYLSIMSYAYSHSLPPPIRWIGEVQSCSEGKKCPEGLKCIGTKGSGAVCLPDCGSQEVGKDTGQVYVRFSGGELPLPHGTKESEAIPETGYPEWFIPYYYCASRISEKGGERLARLLDKACPEGRCVRCEGGRCSIDWNHDGVFAAAPSDIDGDGELSAIPLGDMDDAARIIEVGRRGPYTMVRRNAAVFYMSFEGDKAENLLPYPVEVTGEGGGRVLDVTNRCDEVEKWRHCRDEERGHAIWFPGGDGVTGLEAKAAEGYCVAMTEGTALSIRVKPLDLADAVGEETLFDSATLRLRMAASGRGVRWVALVLVKGVWKRLEIEDVAGIGKWSRLTLHADVRSGRLEFHVRRGKYHPVVTSREVRLNLGSVCRWSVGSALGGKARWRGFLDDPLWIGGPVREM